MYLHISANFEVKAARFLAKLHVAINGMEFGKNWRFWTASTIFYFLKA
jgi:hypothetical protein